MAISSIPGLERYQQQQNLAANLQASESQRLEASDGQGGKDKAEIEDPLKLSGKARAMEKVASHYRLGEINFREILSFRNELFESGFINLRQVNSLTMATQSYPDDKQFDLQEALETFSSDSNNFYLKPDLETLTRLVQNMKWMNIQQH